VGVALLAAPARVAGSWPWALTPLAGRAIGAWFIALGFAAGLARHERDLARLRVAAVTYVVFGLLQAGALVRFRGDVDWTRPATWLYVAVLAALTATGAYGWLRSTPRRHPRDRTGEHPRSIG
jgi:hypothetical protein